MRWNQHETQVPSRIAYNPLTWGNRVKAEQQAHCWTKLLLDKDAPITDRDDKNLNVLEAIRREGHVPTPSDKTAEDVVADYLAQLYKHIMKHLEMRNGGEVILATIPIAFWFSHPAVWTLKAVEATKNAARKAGFGTRQGDELHLIKEPEAAAIYCLNDKLSDPSDSSGPPIIVSMI